MQASDRIDFGHIGKEHGGDWRDKIIEPWLATAKTDSSVVPQARMQAWFQALAFISVVTFDRFVVRGGQRSRLGDCPFCRAWVATFGKP